MKAFEELNGNSALDVKKLDERDFMIGGEMVVFEDLPDEFILSDKRHINQRIKNYKMSCTAQATVGASNEYLYMHGDKKTKNSGFILFDEAVDCGVASRTRGAYLIDVIKLGKKFGFLDFYCQVTSLLEIMNAIYNGEAIVTGSNKIKWGDIRSNGLVTEVSDGSGHAFYIKGWSKNKLIGEYRGGFYCKNSYGGDYQDNGGFWIPFDLFNEILFITRKSIVINPKWMKLSSKERFRRYLESRKN